MATLEEVIAKNPHLGKYLESLAAKGFPKPVFLERLGEEVSRLKNPNIIYPVGDPIFIHLYRPNGYYYVVIEPPLPPETEAKYNQILELMLKYATRFEETPEKKEEFELLIDKLINRITSVEEKEKRKFFRKFEFEKIPVTPQELEVLRYHIKKNILENGKIEPLIRDPYIEDIHCVGTTEIHITHKLFGMLATNLQFAKIGEIDEFLRNMTERIGHPVSDARPVVDAALPDGSRLNVVYSEDVSMRGPSFTIRKFSEKPYTLPRLVAWNTLSAEMAGFLWLCVENGINAFVCGETASGKTTTLNALIPFINHKYKVYSAEDTPEIISPHKVWQRMLTRESVQESARVEMYDLLRAALRSRPNFIIVGEIRGKEGFVAFQAMQTGHYVLSTFHAPSVKQLIQRFIGEPINIPERFMDNLNLVVFQQNVYEGGRVMRRCISIDEILKYSKEKGGVLTRNMFMWEPDRDQFFFNGINNSYILEEKIAPRLKYKDKAAIYRDLEARATAIQKLVEAKVFDYDVLNRILDEYFERNIDSIRNPAEFLREFDRLIKAVT
ncbi:MAG: type II/IV secretion system ATPase subunit [Thermoplasmata archaeon]